MTNYVYPTAPSASIFTPGIADNQGYAGLNGSIDNFFTGNLDWQRQQIVNQFNMNEAQKNRDFQERMSNTAYQRAFSDMRSAGLNPYLAYNQGGSSSPSGSSAYGGSTRTDNRGIGSLFNLLSGFMNSAFRLANSNINSRISQVNLETSANKLAASKNKLATSKNFLRNTNLRNSGYSSAFRFKF